MKRPKYNIAYVTALRAYSRAVSRARLQPGNHTVGSQTGVQTTTGQMESYSPEDTTITDSQILSTLTHRAIQLCIQIIGELKFNNALWYFDHTLNKRDLVAIKELREKGILSPTEDTRIHFVNPDIIRKGNKLLVAANTAAITEGNKVCRTMIKPLNKKNIEINPIDLTNLTQG